MSTRQFVFLSHCVQVAGLGDSDLWVTCAEGSFRVSLDGATVERRDLVLEEASKVDAEWFGLARDPEPGSTWVEASGLALWNLSSGDRLAQFPNPQDVSIVGKRWIVACAGSPSDGATERYLVHELKTGRVASSFEVPPDAFVLGATDAAMFFATGTTLLAVRLGGGAPQAVGGPRRQWGASNRSCAQDGDHLFVTAVEGDGSHSVLRVGPSNDPPKELLRLAPDDAPWELAHGDRGLLVASDRALRWVRSNGEVTTLLDSSEHGLVSWVANTDQHLLVGLDTGAILNPFVAPPPSPVLVFPANGHGWGTQPLTLTTSKRLNYVGTCGDQIVFDDLDGPIVMAPGQLVEGGIEVDVLDALSTTHDDDALEPAEVVFHSRDLLRLRNSRHPVMEMYAPPMGLVRGDEVLVDMGRVRRLVAHKDGKTFRVPEPPASPWRLGSLQHHLHASERVAKDFHAPKELGILKAHGLIGHGVIRFRDQLELSQRAHSLRQEGQDDYIAQMLLGGGRCSKAVLFVEHDDQELLLTEVARRLGRSLDVETSEESTLSELAADVNEELRAAGDDLVLAAMGPEDECFALVPRQVFEELVASGLSGVHAPTRPKRSTRRSRRGFRRRR